MRRTARDNRPYIKPVQKAEVSEKHFGLRLILFIAAALVAAGAFAFGISQLATGEKGLQEIGASAKTGNTVAGELRFMYDLGRGELSPKREQKALSEEYTALCRQAYKIFVADLANVNASPNTEVEIEKPLEDAIKTVLEKTGRYMFFAPLYERLAALAYAENDAEAALYDPFEDEDFVSKLSEFALAEEHVRFEFGADAVTLCVSEEYLDFAKEYGITVFANFGVIKTAPVVDFVGSSLKNNGHKNGYIESVNGCLLNLDNGFDTAINVPDGAEGELKVAASANVSGLLAAVLFSTSPAGTADDLRAYTYENGTVRTAYVSENGVCKQSHEALLCYSYDVSCTQIAADSILAFADGSYKTAPLPQTCRAYVDGKTVVLTDKSAEITNIYGGYEAK